MISSTQFASQGIQNLQFEAPSYPDLKQDALEPSKSLRIALLGYRSHPHVGGQGIYLKQLSRALVNIGHRVDVISGPPYPELDHRVTLIKVPSLDLYSVFPHHVRAFQWRFLLSWSDFFEWFSMASGGFAEPYTFGRRAYRLINKTERYDVIHDNQSLCFSLLKLQHQVPLAVTIHHPITQDLQIALEQEPRWGHRLLLKRWYSFLNMQRKVAQKLRHIVTVSQCSKVDIAHAFKCQGSLIEVIPNGIDTDTFTPRPNIPRTPYRLMTTASSDQPLKGLHTLLHALKHLQTQFPHLHLRIIGQLKKGGSSEKLINELKLESAVSFRHQLSEAQLCDEYAKCQIAVCPSIYEGFGLPALEALACGAPLVCSNGGALPEVVGDAAQCYPAGDSSALANSIAQLLQNPSRQKQLSQNGRLHALQNFTWEQVALKYSAYYRNLINAKNLHANDRL